MAPHTSAVSALRAITFRLSSASEAELPHVVAYISQSLVSCKLLLSNQEAISQKDADAAVVINRFNARITSLLQDRSVEGRWAAIVLVKAAIESGSWETLRKSNPWVRGLLNILKKPDPPITRCLCTIALTRIFMLTWSYPTLIREITTPALPTFVSTCLNNLNARGHSQDELRATLECFAQLIPHHPTIFRTNQDAIGKLLQSIIEAPNMTLSGDLRDLVCRVSVLLYQCEPKGGAADKWEKSLGATVRAAHTMADKTFVGVDEDWQSVAGNNPNKHVLNSAYHQSQDSTDASERPVQRFVIAGSNSLLNNLRVLTSHFSIPTASDVTVPVGVVTDLLTRLFAVTISQTASRSSVKFSRDTAREEREAVAQVLPQIHASALELLSALIDRYGNQLTSTLHSFIDQLLWIFTAEASDSVVKTAIYNVLRKTLELVGPTLTQQTVASLRKLIATCCNDLLPSETETTSVEQTKSGAARPPQVTMNADTFLKPSKTASLATETQFIGLQTAAWNLLPTLLSKLPAKSIPVAVRSQMDRVAAILRHKDAMVASTLNPPSTEGGKGANSLLPLLAREYASEPAVEALLRPRMPIIETGRRGTAADHVLADEEEEDEDEDVEMSDAEASQQGQDEPTTEPTAVEPTISENEAAQSEQSLINNAIHAYRSSNPLSATEPSIESTNPPSTSNPPEVLGKRRLRSSSTAQAAAESEKKRKASPVAIAQSLVDSTADELPGPSAEAGVPTSVVVGESVATVPGADVAGGIGGGDDDDDDDDDEIPMLVMGMDSEEEDEEE